MTCCTQGVVTPNIDKPIAGLSSYATDAALRADTIPAFVALYADESTARAIVEGSPDIRFLDYDWALNEAGR